MKKKGYIGIKSQKIPKDLKDLSNVAYDKLPNNPAGDKEREKRDAELGNIHPKKKAASQKNIIRKKVSKFIDLKRSGDGTIKGGAGFRKFPSPFTQKVEEKPSKETLLQDDPDWQDAASDLTAIKQGHLRTLNTFRKKGFSNTNPDVKKVISQLHQVDRDLARHHEKIEVKDDIPKI